MCPAKFSTPITPSTLAVLDSVHSPVWIVNITNRQIEWANKVALEWWEVQSLSELDCQDGFFFMEESERESVLAGKLGHIKSRSCLLEYQCCVIEWRNGSKGILITANEHVPLSLDDTLLVDKINPFYSPLIINLLNGLSVEDQSQHKKQWDFLHFVPGIIFTTGNDPTWSMSFLSEACFSLTGYHPAELIGTDEYRHYNRIIHPDDLPRVMATINLATTEAPCYEVEYRIYTKERQEKWFWEKGVAIYSSSRQIEGFEGCITDITKLKHTEQSLRESEQRYRLLAENVTDLISRHTPKGIFSYVSPVCHSLLGYTVEEMLGQTLDQFCHAEDSAILAKFYEELENKSVFDPIVYRVCHKNGNYIWLETNVKIIPHPDTGEVDEIIGISRDISKRKQTEEALQQAENQYRDIFENITQGIFRTTLDGRYLTVNPALAKLYGYATPEELLEKLIETQHQLYVDPLYREQLMNQLKVQGVVTGFEGQVYCKDGSIIWISQNVRAVYDRWNRFLYYEGTVENITYRYQTEAKLLHAAYHDSLTGLPNRAGLMKQLNRLVTSHRQELGYGLLFLDLDGFKGINKSLGHNIGDKLLQQTAKRLKISLRDEDKIARFGGDEFVILLEKINNLEESVNIAQRLLECFRQPFQLNEETVFISVSIGIALSTVDYQRPEDMLRDADIALHQAKTAGKNCYVVFNPAMQQAALNRLQLENELRQAVDKEAFLLYYQPIIDLKTQKLSGFEALIRWRHPVRGWISPAQFIPIAEETGLINRIGWWVLHQACQQLQKWKQIYPQAQDVKMNVNLSGHQLKQADLLEQIKQILHQTNLDGRFLKLEITESCFLETVASEAIILEKLRNLGIGICIDDFGTGYSSLSRLHEFPIDTLKIDRSFIQRLETEKTEIVHIIINLAHTLGMNVVAEGIETTCQFKQLHTFGCELGQGYLFSRPIDEIMATQLINENPSLTLLHQ